ncbi:glycosyltransferase [Hoyosella rhizosphaerae]|uniref:Galactofuranosyl transferase GlfT2 n=1 Tax=Hoyosella rhizosphaerae TaxID=1755582 RepID=A0A916XDX5_9ACTN|nr:glycosyltransferase [Hoyosella rhizosphaerae]MBN4927395.1 glycosyltransferase [Hoyosella rhizosphaerae]GGC64746.1 galactofuranosyl transferase GlfT2 [Hoyosella rhizosphaerae]
MTTAQSSLAQARLQRILLPRAGEPLDVRRLYIEEDPSNPRRVHPTSRTSARIAAESEVSLCTYFNAFPASYWRRWSILDSVVLKIEVTGRCRADVYRSKADGTRIQVGSAETTESSGLLELVLDLAPFEDGGWLWCDLSAEDDVEILNGGWYAPIPAPGEGRVAVGIPTFNRPTDCVKALTALGSDPDVLAAIDAVIIPDQGTKKAADEPGFEEAAAQLGDRLRIHNQGNIGGSGGYSRVMYEALRTTDSPYILFMDDDIEIEPDSILRAIAFSRFARNPLLVGGQMLNLQNRAHLHVMGEVVRFGEFVWGPAPHTDYDHDFAANPLSESPELHRRIDVTYNAWWMCLIPRQVAEEIGQPLPLFIKWDDAEYGLRAAAAGYPTVTLPGTAIWHMAWSDKDDVIDWQAYYHMRNRLIVAALHKPGGARALVKSTMKPLLKHLLCLEYSTVALQNQAIEDFLAGPDILFNELPTSLGKIQKIRAEFPDAVVAGSATDLPLPSGADVGDVSLPTNAPAKLKRFGKAVIHNLRPTKDQHHERPQLNVATLDARWFLLSQVDGVTVTTADGRGVVYRKRDKKLAAQLFKDALRLRRELGQRFPEMQKQYRAAAPTLTSRERWGEFFAQYN